MSNQPKTYNVLFLDGPADGLRMIINGLPPTLRVPVPPEHSRHAVETPSVTQPYQIKTETYNLHVVDNGRGNCQYFYLWSESHKDILELLFRRYPNPL